MLSNNSTRTPQQYADKLAGMGAQISPAEVLTSGQATARFLGMWDARVARRDLRAWKPISSTKDLRS